MRRKTAIGATHSQKQTGTLHRSGRQTESVSRWKDSGNLIVWCNMPRLSCDFAAISSRLKRVTKSPLPSHATNVKCTYSESQPVCIVRGRVLMFQSGITYRHGRRRRVWRAARSEIKNTNEHDFTRSNCVHCMNRSIIVNMWRADQQPGDLCCHTNNNHVVKVVKQLQLDLV